MAISLVTSTSSTEVVEDWEKDLKRKNKEIISNGWNVRIIFQNHPDYKGHIRWNTFFQRIEVTGGTLTGCAKPDNLDDLVTWAQDLLFSRHEITLGREETGRRLMAAALFKEYDPLTTYLDSLVWDSVPRIDNWLVTHAGAESEADGYVNFVGRKWLLSCIARAYKPGCKADTVLVAEGDQGAHKSTMLRILGGEWYSAASGVLGDKDSKQLIGAAWICELPDMSSFSRTDRNAMKAFFSMEVDRYRPPYDKQTITVPRRTVFAATTNDEMYLSDPTGNRRFQPVLLGDIDRAALIRDRDQLFAEAVSIYKAASTCLACIEAAKVVPGEDGRCLEHAWWLSAEQKITAKVHACMRNEEDVWAQTVLSFACNPVADLAGTDGKRPAVPLTTENIIRYALRVDGKDLIKIGTREGMRIAGILKRAGFQRKTRGSDSVWVTQVPAPPTTPTLPTHPSTGSPSSTAALLAK